MAHNVLRASVTADSLTTDGGPATVLVDGADTPITANGLQDYTPTPGDRLLVVQVGGVVEIVQFISRGTVPTSSGGISTFRQTSAPAFPPAKDGDVWYDEANGNRPNRAESSAWVPMQVGTPAIASGTVTDDLVAEQGLNPVKGIVDMRPGAFTCLVHDWRFRDATLNSQRQAGLSSITITTVQEVVSPAVDPTFDNAAQLGAVGSAPPAGYVAGPKCTLLNIVNDTDNFANYNVIPVRATSGLTNGDEVLHYDVDVATLGLGQADWTGLGTIYLNLNAVTQNAALVAGNGVNAETELQWLDASHTVLYTMPGDVLANGLEYFGHYDWTVAYANNFQPGGGVIPVGGVPPTYLRIRVIWRGDTIAAESTTNALICPGFSAWNVGGSAYQPGTPLVRMDHNLPSEEMTLISGLPVTPADMYGLNVRRNPWSDTIPYTGSGTSPQGAGEIVLRYHKAGGVTEDHGPSIGTGSFEAAGWNFQSEVLTLPDDIESIDLVFKQTQASDNSVTHFVLPRLSVAGWSVENGPSSRISDGGLTMLNSEGEDAIRLDATDNSGGANLTGYVAVAPKYTGQDTLDRDSSLQMWAGGNDNPPFSTSQPNRVGVSLDPSYNVVKNGDSPFDLGGGIDGSGQARAAFMADRGTTGQGAPKAFVGVVPGQYPNPGDTAQETGFVFDSDANTITAVGSLIGAAGLAAGVMSEYAGHPMNVPTGWLLCDGSAVSRTTYAKLYDVMRTGYILGSMTAGSGVITGVAAGDVAKLWVGMAVESVAFSGTGNTITSISGTTVTIGPGTSSFTANELFQGLAFGCGNESPTGTFALPDMRRRSPIGVGGDTNAFGVLGAHELDSNGGLPPGAVGDPGRLDHRHTHGTPNHTHTDNYSVPSSGSHVHNIAGQSGGTGTANAGTGTVAAKFSSYDGHAHGGGTNNNVADAPHTHTISGGVTSSGAGTTDSQGVAGGNVGYHAQMAFNYIVYTGG